MNSMETFQEDFNVPRFTLGGRVTISSSNPTLNSTPLSLIEDPPMMPNNTSSRIYRNGNSSLLDYAEMDSRQRQRRRSISSNGGGGGGGELLMKEFTTDEVGILDSSPSAQFKSSYAKEVVQNVRKSMSMHSSGMESSMNSGSHRDSIFKSQFALNNQNMLDLEDEHDYHRFSLPRSSSSSNRFSSSGRSKSSSSLTQAPPPPKKSDAAVLTDEIKSSSSSSGAEDNNLWMSAATFSRILDRQEDAEKTSSLNFNNGTSSRLSNKSNGSKLSNVSSSYMDEETRVPIEKLRQTYDELGFENSEEDWINLRNMLREKDQLSYNGDLVKTQDFYNALHVISNKKREINKTSSSKTHEKKIKSNKISNKKCDFKDSMKSDSGGEMESCRSSDSGLGRGLADKEREIVRQERDLTGCYQELANKETELLKYKQDFKKVSEERDIYRRKYEKLKFVAGNSNCRTDLEKEIEHLKWQLETMETSRKTYESATNRLMTFLEQISTVLQSTSPGQRKLIESTRAEVSAVARKTRGRLSLDSGAMSRAESLPGLNVRRRYSINSVGSTVSLHNSVSSVDDPSYLEEDNHHQLHGIIQRNQGGKIKRSQSTHSKIGLPSVNEESTTSLANLSVIDGGVDIRNSTELSSPPPLPPKSDISVISTSSSSSKTKRSTKDRRNGFSSGSSSANYRTYSVHNSNNNNNKKKHQQGAIFTPTYTQKSEPKEEKSLPAYNGNISSEFDMSSLTVSQSDSREDILKKAKQMVRFMKCKLSREKSLTITPKKTSGGSSSTAAKEFRKQQKEHHSLQLISQHKFDAGLG